MTINEKIRWILENRFDGQRAKMAKAVGVTYCAVDWWLQGRNGINSSVLERLAAILPANDILWIVGSKCADPCPYCKKKAICDKEKCTEKKMQEDFLRMENTVNIRGVKR